MHMPSTLAVPGCARVAVITRTSGRSVLLQRAALSVARQSFQDYVWIVVNDGGDVGAVKRTVGASAVPRDKVRIVSHDLPLGMEASSNTGIRASQSEFVVVHDDGDSWDPEFLTATTETISSNQGKRFGGVVTQSICVTEQVRGDAIVPIGSTPYLPKLPYIGLADLLRCNLFPPICFLYRRKWWEALGGYDERLKMLGDWAFNLEFISHANIAVLPRQLAHHHVRRDDRAAGWHVQSSHEPSSSGTLTGHAEQERAGALVVNDFLRRHAPDRGNVLTAMLAAMAQDAHSQLRENGLDPELPPVERPDPRGSSVRSHFQLLDEYDRCWTMARFNETLWAQRKRMRPAALRTGFLRPEMGWDEVLSALRRSRIAIQAPRDFDALAYLGKFPDVAAAVHDGTISSAYMHYLLHGRQEGRTRFIKANER